MKHIHYPITITYNISTVSYALLVDIITFPYVMLYVLYSFVIISFYGAVVNNDTLLLNGMGNRSLFNTPPMQPQLQCRHIIPAL